MIYYVPLPTGLQYSLHFGDRRANDAQFPASFCYGIDLTAGQLSQEGWREPSLTVQRSFQGWSRKALFFKIFHLALFFFNFMVFHL